MISQEIKDNFEQGFKYVLVHPSKINDEFINELKDYGFDIRSDVHVPIDDFYITDCKPINKAN